MRLLILTKTYPPEIGGIASSVHSIAKSLNNQGHRIVVMKASYTRDTTRFINNDVTIRSVFSKRIPGSFSIPYIDQYFLNRSLIDEIRSFHPDFIWSFWPNYTYTLSKHKEIPPFLHFPPNALPISFRGLLRGAKSTNYSLKIILNKILWHYGSVFAVNWEKEILEKCHKTIVFSQNVKNQYNHLYPEYKNKVEVVNPGVDRNRFVGVTYDDAFKYICRKESIDKSTKIITYIGRLSPDKHLHMLFDAIQILKQTSRKTYDSITFLIVGSGAFEKILKKNAVEFEDKVRFCGFQSDELEYYYAASWFTVLPSMIESFGMVLVESSICQTPPIAFKPDYPYVQTAADEIIVDGRTGFLVEPANPDALAQNILKAINLSDHERFSMGIQARNFVLDKFNWDQFVNTIIQAL